MKRWFYYYNILLLLSMSKLIKMNQHFSNYSLKHFFLFDWIEIVFNRKGQQKNCCKKIECIYCWYPFSNSVPDHCFLQNNFSYKLVFYKLSNFYNMLTEVTDSRWFLSDLFIRVWNPLFSFQTWYRYRVPYSRT
jgi:hypothetical protein